MAERPLSPHLQIYRPMLTMMMSIAHRLTGMALYAGSLLVAWWLVATASGEEAYALYQAVAGSILGQIVLVGFTWALLHHAIGGIRHLIWDAGRGYGLRQVEWMARLTLALSVLGTALVWVLAYAYAGGAP